jgi:hypothetical protein
MPVTRENQLTSTFAETIPSLALEISHRKCGLWHQENKKLHGRCRRNIIIAPFWPRKEGNGTSERILTSSSGGMDARIEPSLASKSLRYMKLGRYCGWEAEDKEEVA